MCKKIWTIFFVLVLPAVILLWQKVPLEDWSWEQRYKTAILEVFLFFVAIVSLSPKDFFSKITKVAFGDMVLELNQATKEANESKEELKSAILESSKITYGYLANDIGQYSDFTFEERYKTKKKLDENLRNLGVSTEQIKNASNVWKTKITNNMARNIISSDVEEVRNAFSKLLNEEFRNTGHLSPDKIDKFIADNSITDQTTIEKARVYRKFIEEDELSYFDWGFWQ